jgi:hypothetical protein
MRGCFIRLIVLFIVALAVLFLVNNSEYFKKQFNKTVESTGEALKLKDSNDQNKN